METKLIRQRIAALLIFLVCTLAAHQAVAGVVSHTPDTVFYNQYSYIIVLEEGQKPRPISDEDFFDMAAKVVFPVNKYDLPTNSPLLRELEQTIIPQINSDSLRLAYMVFRGAASPEGPLSLNQKLGQQRVQSLFNFVASRIDAPVDKRQFTIDTDIEDYRSLCIMMQRAGDRDYEVVKQLCDLHLPHQEYDLLKDKLKKADGGQLWARLLKQYFPELRAARFIIYLEKVKPIEEEPVVTIDTIPTLPTIPTIAPIEPAVPTPTFTPDTLLRREFLSIKTNLLFYGVYMPGYNRWCPIPNVAIEYYPWHGHFTFGASFDCPWWQDYDAHKYFQVRNYQLETRYYLRPGDIETNQPGKGAAFRGLYFQAYGHLGLFGICFDADRGWVGEGLGAGLGIGYVLPLSKKGHWRLEFQLQAGWFGCKYDPYQYENPVDPTYHDDLYYYKWTMSPSLFKKRQYRFNWFGPTRVGITLTYDLLYRRIQKKGISLKSTELYEPNRAYRPYGSYESYESYEPYTTHEPYKSYEPYTTHEPHEPYKPYPTQERRTAE